MVKQCRHGDRPCLHASYIFSPPALPRLQNSWQLRGCCLHHKDRAGRCIRALHANVDAGPSTSTANSREGARRAFDVVALGNLCVDVFVQLDQLPSLADVKQPELLRKLTMDAATGDTSSWEAGAQSNFMIAASRLGLRVASAANLGQDVYGTFLSDILQKEGVLRIEPLAPGSFEEQLRHTLLCFVLVGPCGSHQFCSRYDFGPWPLLPGVNTLPGGVMQMLGHTSALFVNGFIFDELPVAVVLSAISTARKAGAATFFDPGPRAWTLGQGERKQALEAMLDASHVVLMTQEEAQAVTGESDPEAAAAAVVQRPGSLTEWCVIKLGPQGALLRTKTPPRSIRQPAIQVPVADTVGCGDSFAAAIVLGYIQQQPLEAVLALSNAVGAATATASGAGRNVASAAVVRRLLLQQAAGEVQATDSTGYEEWAAQVAATEVSDERRNKSIAAGQEDRHHSRARSFASAALQLLDSQDKA